MPTQITETRTYLVRLSLKHSGFICAKVDLPILVWLPKGYDPLSWLQQGEAYHDYLSTEQWEPDQMAGASTAPREVQSRSIYESTLLNANEVSKSVQELMKARGWL